MQHNSQDSKLKPDNYLNNAKFLRLKGSVHIQDSSSSHERYESDFGIANGDPDNVRRQRQDYSDKWAKAPHNNSEINK